MTDELSTKDELQEKAEEEFDAELENILEDLDASDLSAEKGPPLSSSDNALGASLLSPAQRASASPVVSPPPLKPPPLKRSASQAWAGRTRFEELFVPDSNPLPTSRGGLEQKVEFLREKLKRTEAQVMKFRNAWSVRESEMEHIETLLENGQQEIRLLHGQIETANYTVRELEEKRESEERAYNNASVEYEARLTEANEIYQKLEDENAQRWQAAEEQSQINLNEIDELENRISLLLQEALDDKRSFEEVRDGLSRELSSKEEQLDLVHSKLVELENDSVRLTSYFEETRSAYEHDLEVRNEAIDKYKTTIDTQRHSIAEKEEKIEELMTQLTNEFDAAAEIRLGLENQLAQSEASSKQELEDLRVGAELELDNLRTAHAEQSEQIRVSHEQELEEFRANSAAELGRCEVVIENLRSEIQEEQRALSGLQKDVEERDTIIAGQTEELGNVRELLSGREAVLEELQQEFNLSTQKVILLEERIQEGGEREKTLENALSLSEQSSQELQNSLTQSGEQLQQREDDYAALKNEMAQLEGTLVELQEQMAMNIDARDEAIDNLRTSLDGVEEVKKKQEERLSLFESEREDERSRLEQERRNRSEQILRVCEKLGEARQLLN